MSALDGRMRRRFGRQIRLAEVGEQGQIELCRASVLVSGTGDVAAAERVYLAAAGVEVAVQAGVASPVTDEVGEALAALSFESEEARAFAEGALRALVAMRGILRVG